jgi:type I restriction enzyme S subunit
VRIRASFWEDSPWPTKPAKVLFSRVRREPRESDDVVTAFRDGTVTLRSNRRIDGFTNSIQEHGYQGVRVGDLVIHSMDGFAGAIGVADADGKASPVVHCYLPRPGVHAPFYAYVLRDLAMTGFVQSLAKGIRERSTAFDAETFRSLVLPYPPESFQRMITEELDQATAAIDDVGRLVREMAVLLRERRTSTIHWVLQRGATE